MAFENNNIKMTPATRTFPLSGRQHLILTENTLRPDLPLNCEVMWMEVHGPLDAQALQTAFRRICVSHEALRATLVEEAQGTTRLAIASEPIRDLQVVDGVVDDFPHWLSARCARPFGADEPLFDAAAIRSADGWILFMNMSHLITDGWSYYRLFADWSAAYADALAARLQMPEAVPGLSARLSRNEAEETATALAAWEKVLNRADRPQFFGEDHARSGLVSRVTRDVPAGLAEALHGRANGLPPSVTALVACAAAVHRTARPEQVSLAVPFLNRSQEERATIGLMMQIVPTRAVTEDIETFRTLAEQLKDYADQVRPIRHAAVPGHVANAHVALNYYPPGINAFGGVPATTVVTTATELITSSTIDAGGPQVGMDVTIRLFSDAAGQLRRVSFDYDTGAWPDPGDRARFAQAYMRLLEAAAADLDLKIGDVDVLRAGDAADLIFRTPSLGADTPAVSSILAQAALRPDAPAVICGDVALTYAELAARIRSFARGLSEKGVGPGDLVAIGMERSTDLVVALLGTMQAGAAYVPIDPHQPENRIAMIGEDAHCALSVVDGLSGPLAKALPRTCSFADLLAAGQAATGEPAGPGPLAYVIFTSGSTGRPKGVRVRQHGLSAFLAAMAKQPGLAQTDRVLAVTTVSFDIAALELFGPLVVGGVVRLASAEDALDGARLAALMAQDGTTVFQATPATYKLLLTAGWQAPNVTALCGGEALPRDLAEAILPCCGALWNMYGPTETTIWSSVERVVAGRAVRLGDPIAGTSLSVRTDTLALAPRGTPGELVIGGEGLAEGYHERPDLTVVQFPQDPLDRAERLYRTGDGARVAADGRIEFLGRLDFQVKVRGYRIELGEVETAVRAAVGVSDAVVATFTDASDQTALVAHVVPDGPFDEARTRAAVAAALPAYMRPSAYVLLDALPLTPNGKVDRKALKAPAPTMTTSAAVPDAAFADDLQRSLASIFSRLLGRGDVGPDAHFFEMGGHSLLALNLVEEVEKATGAKLSLGTVFAVPVLSDLAVWIREGGQASGHAATAVVPLQPEGDGVPIFCLCGIELYRPVALAMGRTNPVFGLYVEEEGALLRQAVEGEIGNVSIGGLAVAYADAIERNAGPGPIHLMGASFGGIMALEVADLLALKGREVASVVMLDTLRPDEIRHDWLRTLAGRLRTLLLRPDVAVARIRARLGAGRKKPARKGDGVLTAADKDGPDFARLRELAYIEAMRGYQPSRKTPMGQVILVRATDHSIFGHGVRLSADYGWSQALGRDVDVMDVDGNHLGILRDDKAEATGRMLAERLFKPVHPKTSGLA